MLDLTNYIGLKGCGLPVPESGVYINSLPGISTERMDKIANSEQLNFAGVWSDIQARAFLRLENDVINQLYSGINNAIKLNQVIYQTRRLLKSQNNAMIRIPAANLYAGVYQMLPESRYAEYRLNEIYVYSYDEVTTTLKVWDVNDESVLFEKEITLTVGLNVIPVNIVIPLKYRIIEIFIGVDTSNFDSIQTLNDFYYWYTNDWACAAQSTFGYGAVRGVFQLYPATYDTSKQLTINNIIKTGLGRGIAVGSEIRCSVKQFIYDNRELLTQSLLYLLGAEMMLEQMGSPRLNFFTASNGIQQEEIRIMFEKRYIDNLKRSLNTIPLQGEGICFDCEETFLVTTKSRMP